MTKEKLLEVAKQMINAPSCCPELVAAGQNWIDSVGKDDEHEKAEQLIAEIKDDVTTIDDLVEFANSPRAAKIFGAGVKGFIEHANELQKSGAQFCDCKACTAALVILKNKSVLLD